MNDKMTKSEKVWQHVASGITDKVARVNKKSAFLES
jgi:hypothetical protein